MAGPALARTHKAGDSGRQIGHRYCRKRPITAGTVGNKCAAIGGAYDGQRSATRMSATFGAAGDMDRKPVIAASRSGEIGGERARGDISRGADRRPGAGNDIPPRVAGAGDKAQRFGIGGECGYRLLSKSDHYQRAARGRIHAAGAYRLSRLYQSPE
jgi:hypothetical protein